jgi:hypothetical protein
MSIGIGLHCWYCEHGPCNGECSRIMEQEKKSKIRDQKIEKILEKIKKEKEKNNK